jgi:exonuclease SbcC
MTGVALHDIEITNFRSIKGTVLAPLDAKVVLIHGANGAGKTSLLAAIELALTRRISSLERADPNYASQLLHRSANGGKVSLRTVGLAGDNRFEAALVQTGFTSQASLQQDDLASFFAERCYLPQALLGQLLQIYQESDATPNSHLSRFVAELLGLDRLDAIETGLQPVADLRNLRKTTDRYSQIEFEKAKLERALTDRRRTRQGFIVAINTALDDINDALINLGNIVSTKEANLDSAEEALSGTPEEQELSLLADWRRQLESFRREVNRNAVATSQENESVLAEAHVNAKTALEAWQLQFGPTFARLHKQAIAMAPTLDYSQSDAEAFRRAALTRLREQRQHAVDRASRGRQESKRREEIAADLEVTRKNIETIDGEIARIAENAAGLGTALAELSSFVSNDICPVCDRDFAEKKQGSLANHLNHKIRALSGSAERLLGLSRNRGDLQLRIERLEREAASLTAGKVEPRALLDLDRNVAAIETIIAELDGLAEPAVEGSRLAAAETAARRALTERQSRDLARTATMATLTEFARVSSLPPPEPIETPDSVIARLLAVLEQRAAALNARAAARRKGSYAVQQARAAIARRDEVDTFIQADERDLRRTGSALARAAKIRGDAQKIRAQVETVRSRIIRREFNDRLNRVWRDLFVRLAPSEQFVPAFRIPSEPTNRLQPKLITTHRSGGEGGAPGAMLSTGNLNTAALTLFIALHLSVAAQLPWLILDDPVQSMDDVHVTHFAALLRTLSKEQERQVIIAVHNRQLFEYLKLELSPAFAGDSLLTVELSRSLTRDTLCLSQRQSFLEETALRFAA